MSHPCAPTAVHRSDAGSHETRTPVTRDIAIVNFITSIKFSDSEIVYPPPISAATPEEAAVIWLIENTNLSVGNPSDEFRLTQKYALLVLYYATNGDLWTNNDGWLDPNTDECEWNGITACERVLVDGIPRDVVTEIRLNDNNLIGDFPADIALLQGLQVLWLFDNSNLTGQIPTSIGLLSSMEDFAVGNCGMSGPLPEIMSNWTNLREVRGLQWWLFLVSLFLFCLCFIDSHIPIFSSGSTKMTSLAPFLSPLVLGPILKSSRSGRITCLVHCQVPLVHGATWNPLVSQQTASLGQSRTH